MKKLTPAVIEIIASAVSAEWDGDRISFYCWESVLEHASYEGFDVEAKLAEVNSNRPLKEKPIELMTLEERQNFCSFCDQNAPNDHTLLIWFEDHRKAVKAALANLEN